MDTLRGLQRRAFLGAIGMGTVAITAPGLSTLISGCTPARGRRKPNFVFFLVDDMGWTDAECYGSSFYETPNIDRLASRGMLFTDAYAASPVCSPTRASILTGKHPARLNITDWIGGGQRGLLLPAEYEHALPLEEVTFAEILRQAGYITCFIGKWHLGDNPEFFPQNQGFDLNIAGHGAGQPASYFYPYRSRNRRNTYWDVPDLVMGEEGEYLTDRLTDEALHFLDSNSRDPFLLYLSHYAVHTPLESKEDLTGYYRDKVAGLPPKEGPEFISEKEYGMTRQYQDNPVYAGMIQSVDESIGRIMKRLEELGVAENTVIIFMSDNGGLTTLARSRNAPTAVLPLRAGKGWLYEGGIREPMIIRWPGVVREGSICNEAVTSTDFYPTILEMAGLPLLPDQHADGRSLVRLLKEDGELYRDALYWHFPHYHGSGNRPSGAVRAGEYKLVEWYEDGSIELFNLREDIGEKYDISQEMPGKAGELREMLHRWLEEVDARMPMRDPDIER